MENSTQEIILTYSVTSKPECKETLEKAIEALAMASRLETGCLLYAVHRDVQDGDHFVLIERWASSKALEEHIKTDHFVAYEKISSSLVLPEPEVTYLTPLFPGEKGQLAL